MLSFGPIRPPRHDSANQKKTLKYLKINDIPERSEAKPERSEAKRTSEASEPNSWGVWGGGAVSPPNEVWGGAPENFGF